MYPQLSFLETILLKSLTRKGIADEILAKKESERGSKRTPDNDSEDAMAPPQKRSRSLSASSMDTVSTISTNPRRSPSPRRRSPTHPQRTQLRPKNDNNMKAETSRKRRRQSISSSSISSREAYHNRYRHTRRRYSSFSPDERGRQRSRFIDMVMDGSLSRSRSRSRTRSRSCKIPSSRDRNRAWHSRHSHSPPNRPRNHERRTRSRSRSPPIHGRRRSSLRYNEEKRDGHGMSYRDDDRTDYRHRNGQWDKSARDTPSPPPKPRERSLSPYSKRVAMTQAMTMGR